MLQECDTGGWTYVGLMEQRKKSKFNYINNI
jgi:hypothetical protein